MEAVRPKAPKRHSHRRHLQGGVKTKGVESLPVSTKTFEGRSDRGLAGVEENTCVREKGGSC